MRAAASWSSPPTSTKRTSSTALKAKAHANGVTSVVAVGADFIKDKEPNVRAFAALWSPDTGILEAEAYVKALEHLCRAHDVAIVVGSPLVGAETPCGRHRDRRRRMSGSWPRPSSMPPDSMPTSPRQQLGGMRFKIYPCRGEYAELAPSKRHMVNGLVYPLPHSSGAGLGVHLAKTTWGR